MLARNIHDEDTIEMQLSAADLETLTRAAEAAEEAEAAEAAARMQAVSAAAVSIVAPPPVHAAPVFAVTAPARTPPRATVTATAPAAPAAPARPASAWPAAIAPPPAPKAISPIVVELAPPGIQLVSPKPVAVAPTDSPTSARPMAAAPRPRPMSAFGLRVAAVAAVAVAALVALLYWPSSRGPDPAATPTPGTPSSITAPVTEPVPQRAAEPPTTEVANTDPPPVRFANPFDAGEVFEFPAGTSYVEARDQVAQVLLARARERGERNTLPLPARKTTATTHPDPANNQASLARQL